MTDEGDDVVTLPTHEVVEAIACGITRSSRGVHHSGSTAVEMWLFSRP